MKLNNDDKSVRNLNVDQLKMILEEDVKKVICDELSIKDKRLTFMQYLNTTILSIIGTVTMVIFITLTNIRAQQVDFSKELLRLKSIQDINVANVKSVESRLSTLELNYLDYIKTWVDQNYLRKPQK